MGTLLKPAYFTNTEGVYKHQCPWCKCIFYSLYYRQRFCCEAHCSKAYESKRKRKDNDTR